MRLALLILPFAFASLWALENCAYEPAQEAFMRGDYKKALEYYDVCVANNQKASDAYLLRANTYRELNDSVRAFADYDKSIALAPKSYEIYAARAYAHKYFGDYQKAILDYDKALALNPSWSEIYYNRALIKAEIGDYDAAIDDLSVVIGRDSYRNYIYFYARGYIYAAKGDHHKAIADFTSAIAGNSNLRQAYECRAISYEITGDLENAKKDREIDDINAYIPCAAPW
ncbi:MAG: tetratricopeptide repeat protein [Helicobacteraceae bacterium]|jgi:tetratricopeptide (TPR) repeat protein|nr:tetratricopeptide repeat protein [Helicobacteraceae bacterium]